MSVLFQSKIDELVEEDRAGSVSFYLENIMGLEPEISNLSTKCCTLVVPVLLIMIQ